MTGRELQKWSVDGMDLLVFRLQGIRLGVDLEQIDEMLKPELAGGQGLEPVALHELIPFPKAPVVYEDPQVLVIAGSDPALALKIDQPENIVYLGLQAIRPLPLLVARCRTTEALWGVGLLEEEPLVLLDCLKLAAGRNRRGAGGTPRLAPAPLSRSS